VVRLRVLLYGGIYFMRNSKTRRRTTLVTGRERVNAA
jgi:hypothetical protein